MAIDEPRDESEPEEKSAHRTRRRRDISPLERRAWGHDPLLGLESIRTTMTTMLNDLFRRRADPEAPWEPLVDLYEREDCLIMEMSLPGVSRSDLQMHAYHKLLIVSGEIRHIDVEDPHFHVQERRRGAFHRSIPLPYEVHPEKIDARLRDGVLRVTLPIERERTSRSVPIEID